MRFPIHNTFRLWVLLSLLLCTMQSCVVQRIDHTPYAQTDYYHHTLQELEKQPPVASKNDSLQVGWAKVNITPPVGSPLAGYGKRKGLRYSAVHDSVWVRTFAFDNGQTEVIFVALDMLIAPMTVAAALEKEYAALGLSPGQVYLSATHTHSSFGGWGQKLVGKLMAGRYSKQLVQQTTAHIVQCIQLARQNKQPSQIGYSKAYAPHLVRNRLTGSLTGRDTTIRFFKIEQDSCKTAVLATFAAHPTILPSMDAVLSRDYPGELVDQLEKSVDFAAFAAGAVGSQAVMAPHGDTYESTAAVGQELAAAILEKLPAVELTQTARLGYARHSLLLPKPQWRLHTNYRFAPFLFNRLFGKYPAYINSMQLGEAVLLGVPADYSGELLPLLEQRDLPVVVTGFNGGYIGYITPDQHYQMKKYETRSMNFYGPHSGSYLTDILSRIIQQYKLQQP
ncbi:neutral/alkaline non-lysosomal ceramidase N-terminal domain-containing protein [Pontibacter sp. HSC-14F20]|uniref:neutral/alkaline non-lysosomal ceramidase N-terminal domain-containing protein n=1 Tax=Pontibacter sp. HSC-14F20 TaxID=2864136 RepID=UPI001C73D93E|nr:neutral/alkaline non-lysosomal ceramidase N-terminal domain-containing protein [Pontibacter sp. HSC-14F20]MBX0332506.1 neutral/alkaline non-lysosomal ceramidase N-terminal domain-containing protein [Pontibacter sp. HSC-14F20]